MWPMLLSAAFAGFEVKDEGDLAYLLDAGRGAHAMPWLLEQLQAHPDDVHLQIAYYQAAASDPALRGPALPGVPNQAPATPRPSEPALGAAIAWRLAVDAVPDGVYLLGTPSQHKERWCPAAQEALAYSPEDPRDLDVVLWARSVFGRVCDWSGGEELASARTALALSGQLGDFAFARAAMQEEVTADVVAAWRRALAARWWKVTDGLYPRVDALKGPEVEALKGLFREHAAVLATSDSASHVRAALDVRRWLGEGEPGDLWARVHALDPGAYIPREPGDKPAAELQLDPARRRVALREEGAGDDPCGWWMARGETEMLAGDPRAALRCYDHARSSCWGYDSNVAFGRAALAADRRLRDATTALTEAVDALRAPRTSLVGPYGDLHRTRWLDAWTEALDVRAALYDARRRPDLAWEDRTAAAALQPTAARLLAIGLTEDAPDPDVAQDALAAALAGRLEPDAAAHARRVLEDRLARDDRRKLGPLYQDDPAVRAARADAEIAKMAPAPAPAPTQLGPFPDITLQVGGEARPLSSIKGPVVLDLWATWCGPCKLSLPHLDGLARQYAGRVTFLAVSVDEEASAAERYLQSQGEPAFTAAWAGRPLMKQLDITGIPRFYVLNADHAVVATATGFGSGNHAIEDALEGALGLGGR